MDSHSFCMSENTFISPLLLKDSIIRGKNPKLTEFCLFVFITSKMCSAVCLALFPIRNLLVLFSCLLRIECILFLSDHFSNFPIITSFKQRDSTIPYCSFLNVSCIWGLLSFLKLWVCFTKFGDFELPAPSSPPWETSSSSKNPLQAMSWDSHSTHPIYSHL